MDNRPKPEMISEETPKPVAPEPKVPEGESLPKDTVVPSAMPECTVGTQPESGVDPVPAVPCPEAEFGELDIQLELEQCAEASTEATAETVLTELGLVRGTLIKTLFAATRARSTASQESVGQYVTRANTSLAAGFTTLSMELGQFCQAVTSEQELALERERAHLLQLTGRIQDYLGTYDLIFAELKVLVGSLADVLQSRDVESSVFLDAPPEVQSQLANYRKGLEIIHRMFSRTVDRKQPLTNTASVALSEQVESPVLPESEGGLQGFITEYAAKFHQVRDNNFHVIQDIQTYADKCRSQVLQSVKTMLAAIDGIDSGLQSDSQVREKVSSLCQADSVALVMVDSWCGAYQLISNLAEEFFANTGIQPQTAAPGTPFNPETMEPQGTVENLDLKNDDVAAVVRRGFTLRGELIRPVQVDIVRNPL